MTNFVNAIYETEKLCYIMEGAMPLRILKTIFGKLLFFKDQ